MQHFKHHILVFDSGVGGLSIVAPIRQQLPTASLCYLADNAQHPYGLLSEQELIARTIALIMVTAAQQKPDIIVIACNSASTVVLPQLRSQLNIPVVGVVPAIKPAAICSSSKVIGLLATLGTIDRSYTDELIADFAPGCEVIRLGSSELVTMVERKLAGETIPPEDFSNILSPLQQHPRWQQMDTIVLACTHFPLVQQELAAAAPYIKHWVDSGDAIAKRTTHLLNNIPNENHQWQNNVALFTNISELKPPLRKCLKGYGFDNCQSAPSHFQLLFI